MKIIVSVDCNWAIGKNGDQLCYISEDLKRFQSLTKGHAVLLGRKTMATFPGGKPLKGRRNLIVSTNLASIDGAEVFGSVQDAIKAAPEDTFVIGGESIYIQTIHLCDTAYVTKVEKAFPADRWFPNLDENPAWTITEEEGPFQHEGLRYSYVTYERKDRDA